MAESQELSQSGEGSSQHHKQAGSGPEHETPNPLALRLKEIRSNAHTRTEKFSLLLKASSPSDEAVVIEEPVSFEALSLRAEELSQVDISSSEYIIRSSHLLQASNQARKLAKDEQRAAEKDNESKQIAMRDADRLYEELGKVKGIKRIVAAFDRSKLTKQRAQLAKQATELQTLAASKKESEEQAYQSEHPIRHKQEDAIIYEAVVDIRAIRSDYEVFLGEVLKDRTITGEIQEAYIRNVITPRFDGSVASDDRKDAFYAALRNCIQNQSSPEVERKVLRQEVDKFQNEDGFYTVRDVTRALLDGADRYAVTKIVGKIAASDIAEIKAGVESRLTNYVTNEDFRSALERAVDRRGGDHVWDKKGFGEILYSELTSGNDNKYPDMRLWGSLKSSPTANELFGKQIKIEDERIFATALGKSLSDIEGPDIDMLEYYPRPEAIRNLVILAAADYSSYRTVHANGILSSLARRSDWKEILDQAQQAYPTLQTARPFLEQWDYGDQGNKPGVKEATKDFTLSILSDEQADKRLVGLATQSLPNSALLERLHQKGVIPDLETVTSIKEADNFLYKLEEDRREAYRKNGDTDVLHISGYALKDAVRKKLFGLMDSGNEDSQTLESMKRLRILSKKVLENKENDVVLKYLTSEEVVEVIANKPIQPELIFVFPDQAKPLMDDKMRETRSFVFKHADIILREKTDLRFLTNVVGEFGQKSDPLIRGYQACLEAGVLTTAEKDLVLEFGRQFRAISPETLKGYKEAKEGGYEKIYIAQLTALAEKLTGSAKVTDEERAKPYYKDLMQHVYSNNAGHWTSYESNDSCKDRSGDVSELKVKPRYELDLLSQSEIRVKDGEVLNTQIQQEVQAPIFAVSDKMKQTGFDYDKIKTELNEKLDKGIKQVVENAGLSGLSLDDIGTTDERLFLILADSIYGTHTIDSQSVKNLLITYEFANYEDISDYIAGTRDRVSRANNQDYAFLCEVGAFYSDRVKEVNRKLTESAWSNPAIAKLMPDYFKKLSQETASGERQDKINRLQVDRLGLTDNFVRQVGKVLEKRKDRKYTPEEIRKLISRYEGKTAGLTEKSSTSQNAQTRAFYGQLRSQRERTIEAARFITGEEVDAAKVHLGEVNLQQILDEEKNIREGKYDEEQFASYTVQRFIDLFEDERGKIEGELDKFESISGKQREVLYGFITKTKEAAHARMVGGVCVAGDNPDNNPDKNMWNMKNYIQLVLQEPDTLQCQGLALLHHFTQGDKKVLVASLNPSSTYLYSVDEGALFDGMMGTLEEFATENGFDMITLSKNKTIRTNRTGGQFEKFMEDRIAKIGKDFKCEPLQQFSYKPNYQLEDMDIVWEKPEDKKS